MVDSTPQTAALRLSAITERMARAASRVKGRKIPQLIAVSKTFGPDDISPLLAAGQRHFGENRVQEAQGKWPELRQAYSDTVLHLIGPLQTNKVKDAVGLFDVIHSVDRDKLAKALGSEMEKQGRKLACFVQVDIGDEAQKAGVAVADCIDFVSRCRNEYGLEIVGLMCIPPLNEAPGPYFGQLAQLAKAADVEGLSMGMSADFETAILMGATHIRVGSALFGAR